MAYDVLAFIAGVAYGYLNPGKEDKKKLLKNGVMLGLILGVIFAVIGSFVRGFLLFGGTVIATVISVAYLTLFFILGTFLGDALESRRR